MKVLNLALKQNKKKPSNFFFFQQQDARRKKKALIEMRKDGLDGFKINIRAVHTFNQMQKPKKVKAELL